MRKITLVVAFLLAPLTLTGCGGASTTQVSEPVVLGAIYNQTGRQYVYGVPSARGARLAIDEVNRRGGVVGRPVQLVVGDGESTAAGVAAMTAAVLQDHPTTSALFGLSETDMVQAAAPVAARNGRLFLTSGATSPLLPVKFPHTIFLACFGDNVQAAAGAEWAYEALSARTVSITYNSQRSYTTLLQGYFRTSFEKLGGSVLSIEGYTTDDMTTPIGKLKQADVVYLAAEDPQEAIEGVRLLRARGYTGPVLGGDGFDTAELWQPETSVQDVYFTTHVYLGADNTDPAVVDFREAYEEAYSGDVPDGFAALSYDAARLLTAAVAEAGSDAPDKVLEGLSSIQGFKGVTGTISFGVGSHIPRKSVTILEIDRGQRQFVRQLLPKDIPPPQSAQ